MTQLLTSLKHRNFRLFFCGQIFSILGTWMQGTAVSWLVWRLTHSAGWLGAVGFATQIPILALGLYAGVIADRASRYRLILIIQCAAMFQATLLAVLTWFNIINAPIIFMLSLMLGMVFAFDYPARQSFLMDMVGREDISNAVALNSSMVHAARVLGPMAAGLIITEFGEEACFAINAISFIFILTALVLMKKSELMPQEYEQKDSLFNSMSEGIKFVFKKDTTREPLLLLSILSLFIMPYVFFLPHIVSSRFGGEAKELGFMMSMAGVGALTGAIYLAMRKNANGLYQIMKACLAISGLGLIGVALLQDFMLVLFVTYILGISSFLVVVGTQTILQIESPSFLRGRIMSVFTITFFGFAPLGSFLFGQLANKIGVPAVLAIGGALGTLTAIYVMISDGRRTPTK